MIDELLKKYNLKYEDLEPEERATLHEWINALQQGTLTIEKIKDYISAMRDTVEQLLIDEPEFNYIFLFRVQNRKQILLKARLKNYLLLEAFLTSPERAKLQLERALAGIAPKA